MGVKQIPPCILPIKQLHSPLKHFPTEYIVKEIHSMSLSLDWN